MHSRSSRKARTTSTPIPRGRIGRVWTWLILVSCFGSPGFGSTAPAPPERLERPAHRFRIDKPGTDWIVQDRPGETKGSLQLTTADPATGYKVLATVLSTPLPAGVTTATGLREVSLAKVTGDEKYSNVELCTLSLSGDDVPGLRVDLDQGQVVRVAAAFVIVDDHGFVIQVGAPPKEFDGHADLFQRFRDSFEILEEAPDQAQDSSARGALEALAARCGSEIAWADSFEEAAARAKDQDKRVLTYARFYPGFEMSDAAMAWVFTDRRIVELIQDHFVPVRLERGMPTPLRSHDVYGLSPTSFGTSIIVSEPDGTVVDEMFSMNRYVVRSTLELSRINKVRGPTELNRSEGSRLIEKAHASIFGGNLSAAMELLHEYLDLPDRPRDDEARYWLGECVLRETGLEAAREVWEPVLEDAESPFAWRAAATLTSTGSSLGIHPPISYPDVDVAASTLRSPVAPSTMSELSQVYSGALSYLLETQRTSGSWVCGGELSSTLDPADQDLTIAITAIAARSLLAAPASRSLAPSAVSSALRFLRRAHERSKKRIPFEAFMDYGIYADAYTLRLLIEATEQGVIEDEESGPWIDDLIARLREKQKANGGFSYYLSGQIGGTVVPDQSIGFVTGAVTLALQQADEFGAALPEGMIDEALDAIQHMKNPNGSFEYFLHGKAKGPIPARGTKVPGSAGRATSMTLALYHAGRATVDDLRGALDRYVEHQDELAREAGKALMHCGLDGQGSHYVMFNFANTAHAIAALPEGDRKPYRDALLRAMLQTRLENGAFVDNPLIGRAYGAGMALITIDALR